MTCLHCGSAAHRIADCPDVIAAFGAPELRDDGGCAWDGCHKRATHAGYCIRHIPHAVKAGWARAPRRCCMPGCKRGVWDGGSKCANHERKRG